MNVHLSKLYKERHNEQYHLTSECLCKYIPSFMPRLFASRFFHINSVFLINLASFILILCSFIKSNSALPPNFFYFVLFSLKMTFQVIVCIYVHTCTNDFHHPMFIYWIMPFLHFLIIPISVIGVYIPYIGKFSIMKNFVGFIFVSKYSLR